MLAFSASQMRALDKKAERYYGIPGIVLMENAGARAAAKALAMLKKTKKESVCVFSGPGNNGGDGLVVGRRLLNKGKKVEVFLLAPAPKLKGDVLINYKILKKMKARIHIVNNESKINPVKTALKNSGLIIDAIFGIGLNKDIHGLFKKIIEMINDSRVPILALDIPSGLCANSGKIYGVCVKAQCTVTFAALKTGLLKKQGRKMAGKIFVADISMPQQLLRKNKG